LLEEVVGEGVCGGGGGGGGGDGPLSVSINHELVRACR
jgi:hypothetical protein